MIQTDAILDIASELKANHRPFALVTVVRSELSTSAKPGAKAIIDDAGEILGWIGGGCAQPAVISTAQKALQDGKSRLIRVSPNDVRPIDDGIIGFDMSCHSGGTLDIFIDPIIPKPALLVFGKSPCAQALSILAHRTGFEVSAMFSGSEEDIYPDAVNVYHDFVLPDAVSENPPFVIVATQGKMDEESLKAALSTGSNYIGFVASENKSQKIKQFLIDEGQDKAEVNKIISPLGVDIGAVTPEEIALSVLAELVKKYREVNKIKQSESAKEEVSSGSCCSSMNKNKGA